jgi:hypothetical protein
VTGVEGAGGELDDTLDAEGTGDRDRLDD